MLIRHPRTHTHTQECCICSMSGEGRYKAKTLDGSNTDASGHLELCLVRRHISVVLNHHRKFCDVHEIYVEIHFDRFNEFNSVAPCLASGRHRVGRVFYTDSSFWQTGPGSQQLMNNKPRLIPKAWDWLKHWLFCGFVVQEQSGID